MKKIVAREWLYLLGFAVGCGIIVLFIYLVSYPSQLERPPNLTQSPPVDIYDTDAKTFRQWMDEIDEYITIGDKDSIRSILIESDSTATRQVREKNINNMIRAWHELASKKYNEAQKDYEKYSVKKDIVYGIMMAIAVFTYPLFLFIRTILWSIRQVRSKSESS